MLALAGAPSALWLVAAVLQPGATGAYFSDSATSVGNTFRAASSFDTPPPACQGDSWHSATIVVLTEGPDTYHAGNGKEIIFGLGGDDHITGGNGKDCIIGGPGNDTLTGGNGPDYIDGGDGTDICDGGLGPNTILNCEVAATGVPGPEQNTTGEQESEEEEEDPDAGVQRREEAPTPEPTPEPMPEPVPSRTTAGPVRSGGAQNPSQPRPSKTPSPVGIAIWPQ